MLNKEFFHLKTWTETGVLPEAIWLMAYDSSEDWGLVMAGGANEAYNPPL